MEQPNQALYYNIKVLEDKYYKENTEIVSYRIEYILFHSTAFEAINERNYHEALTKQAYVKNTIYPNAMEAYLNDSVAFPYEYDVTIAVTMNQDNIFSMYQDTYIYTGGAHGNTVRNANTYDIRTAQERTLCSFMKSATCLPCISHMIVNQIQTSGNASIYFPDYAQLVPQSINAENFYITPEGVVIYFGLYEIAPYASGIQTFTIPFYSC